MNTFEYIENWKSLSAEEKTQVERRIQTDSAFAQEIAFYWQSKQVAEEDTLQRNNKRFDDIRKSLQHKKAGNVRPLWQTLISVAASFIIIVGAVWLLLGKQVDTNEMAQQYIEANYQTLPATMGGSEEETINKIRLLYNQHNFSQSIALTDSLLVVQPKHLLLLEYKGLSQLQSAQYDNAIKSFQQLATLPAVGNKGLFLMAVAHLKRGKKADIEQAKQILQTIAQDDIAFGKQQAKEWLEQIK
jgi:hypothetical protein